MPKKAVLLKSLTRGRIRASFNKYNLFNLYKKGAIDFRTKSMFQQKWKAKQESRAYHGEFITEGRFNAMFDSKLNSVAQLDSSLRRDQTKVRETPFLLQTYATLEKRLDFALFRAMFASSIRQARQFILHGYVKVNGVKIRHPGYCLKPGDMFNIKPEKVMEALGSKKPSLDNALNIDKKQIVLWNKYVKNAKETPRAVWDSKIQKYQKMPDSNENKQHFNKFTDQYKKRLDKTKHDQIKNCTPNNILYKILKVQREKGKDSNVLSAKDLESIVNRDNSLAQTVFKCYNKLLKSEQIKWETLMKLNDKELELYARDLIKLTPEMKNNLSDKSKSSLREANKILSGIVKNYSLSLSSYYKNLQHEITANNIPFDPKWSQNLQYHEKLEIEKIKENENLGKKLIHLPWQNHVFGRLNPKKPYFTPWKPRQFLAPFVILPNHIEISFKTCHAIYLRDPVARPGHSEVISPFDTSVHERAYMYYVRKGK